MNTAVKVAKKPSTANQNWFPTFSLGQNALLLGLFILVVLSAFAVVYVRDMDRRYFSELQSLENTRDQLQVEWGQLLLEQSTWATPVRVQRIARQQLDMMMPTAKDVVMIKE